MERESETEKRGVEGGVVLVSCVYAGFAAALN